MTVDEVELFEFNKQLQKKCHDFPIHDADLGNICPLSCVVAVPSNPA